MRGTVSGTNTGGFSNGTRSSMTRNTFLSRWIEGRSGHPYGVWPACRGAGTINRLPLRGLKLRSPLGSTSCDKQSRYLVEENVGNDKPFRVFRASKHDTKRAASVIHNEVLLFGDLALSCNRF